MRWTVRTSAPVVGIFFLSLGVLVYEIALTRVFSVALSYHYVFLVLSVAMFGLGAGGLVEHRWRRRTSSRDETPLSISGAATALAMAASIVAINRLGAAGYPLVLAATGALPFVFAGVTLAAAFRHFAAWSALLYGADLLGAASGAILVVRALDAVGGPTSILAASAVVAVAALVFLAGASQSATSVVTAAGSAAVTVSLLAIAVGYPIAGEVPVGRDPNKDLFRLLNDPSIGGEIVATRWSAFGRTDLVRFDGDPDSMTLFIDGAAGAPMVRWDGRLGVPEGPAARLTQTFPGSFPLRFLDENQKDRALVIGPGGGRDILVALEAGVRAVTAVEVNPEFVELTREYSAYNGGIYTNVPTVQVSVGEGRQFVRRLAERYDLIMLSLPITKSSRSYEGYALTENFLFTEESFRDYLAHLTPEGSIVIVTHGLGEALKLVTTVLAALNGQGTSIPDAMQRIALFGHQMLPVLVVQNRPFERARALAMHQGLHLAGFDGQASYVPYAKQVSVQLGLASGADVTWLMMNQNLIDLAAGSIGLRELVKAAPIDIGPVTDDRPFFFKFETGIPGTVTSLLWLSALLLTAVIGAPAVGRWFSDGPSGLSPPPPWVVPFLFASLGVGFMLVEVSLFQRLLLYLGHPTRALALLLFALLGGTGLGSLASGVVPSRHLVRALGASGTAVALGVLLTVPLIGVLFERLGSEGASLASTLLLLGLGLAMGFPFPVTIRLMSRGGLGEAVPWMWAVNGVASVAGSVLAVAVAIAAGYSVALTLGSMAYLGVALVSLGARRHLEATGSPAPLATTRFADRTR